MLSHHQKRELSILARQAFDQEREKVLPFYELDLVDGRYRTIAREVADAQTTFLLRGDTESRDEWRKAEVAKACGKLGLRCCGQADYNKVRAHFHRKLGHTGAANHAMQRSASDGRRTVEYKIGVVLRQLNAGISYANGACRKINHGISLEEASEKQLWKVFFALNKQVTRETKTEAA